MKIFLIILLVIVLLALGIIFFVFQLTGGIAEVADQFFNAVKAKDFSKA
jgi:flagellar basal body-associated protein FliL